MLKTLAYLGRRSGRPAALSIRRLFTVWYLGSLAAILCLFSAALYLTVSAGLVKDMDKGLRLQADGVADTIFAFWQAERTAAENAPGNWLNAPSETLRGEVERGRFVDLMARWAAVTGQLDGATPIQLLDHAGKPLGASTGFRALGLPLPTAGIAAALRGHTVYQTVTRSDGRIRLITRPILDRGTVVYCVQVAGSRVPADASLGRLRRWLFLLIPATLLVTSSVGWLLATTAMRPVANLVAQAQRIGAGRLHERIDVPRTGDELERLGITFNDMLARLEQTFKRMRQFSAAASHELRTPLTIMKGELEVALRKPRDLDEYRRVLRTHLDTIDEMTYTVEELLTLARTDAAEGAIDWRSVDLGALSGSISDTWQALAYGKGVRLEAAAPSPAWVRGEQRLLERLIMNLVDNAVRHTPPGGRVTLRVERRDPEARLTVEDTGSGIAPEELPHIFDRFFKPRPTNDTTRSTGLGLGLCRWIVEVHHGRIEIASVPKRGTTVTVSLPLILAPTSSPQPSAA